MFLVCGVQGLKSETVDSDDDDNNDEDEDDELIDPYPLLFFNKRDAELLFLVDPSWAAFCRRAVADM